MKIKLLIVTTVFTIFCQAQINKIPDYWFFITGKALAGPTSTENKYGKSYTIGAGIHFFNKHSLSTDYVYFNNNYEHESLSASGFYENNGTYDVSYRNYLIFNYRYKLFYPDDVFNPYVSAFMKLGKEHRLFDNGIIPREDTDYNYSADINEYGLVVGAKIDFSKTNRFGLDFSFGFVNARHFIHYGKKHSAWNNGGYVYNYTDSFWKPNIRLNLFFNFIKVKN